jgi:transposase InsO family protein
MYRFRGMKVSTGSIRKTVTQEGLPLARKPRKKRRSSEKIRRFERARPMQLWQSDITQFTLGPSSMRVYLTVFMDDHSRYIVGWRLQSRQTADLVLDAFKDACVRFGKPEEVLTDQGRQYFAWRGKSELERVLEKEGIKHVVSRAHHPQTLGKCERFWETVSNEFWTRAKPQDLEEARVRLKYFIDHYNHQRPHQGLDGAVPADRFFGVAEEVRAVIEKTIEANSLRMSLDELPKPPAFLIGQVGDQRIAFHGSGGGFYLTNEDLRGEQSGESGIGSRAVSVSEYAIRRVDEKHEASKDKIFEENSIQPAVGVPSDSGAGFMADGIGSGAWTSDENCSNINGVLGGAKEQVRGWERVRTSPDPVVAITEPSNGGHVGGMFEAAALPAESRQDG